MKTFTALIIVFILAVIAGIIILLLPGKEAGVVPLGNDQATVGIPDLIEVGVPTKNMPISSPVTITGQARGNWYFEASFPIEIRDASGNIIAQHYAQAQGEWMTENFVPFSSTITFPAQPAGSKGTIILRKDNPSGLPEHDNSVELPVVFQ
jgi:hypothetical protein